MVKKMSSLRMPTLKKKEKKRDSFKFQGWRISAQVLKFVFSFVARNKKTFFFQKTLISLIGRKNQGKIKPGRMPKFRCLIQ